MKYRIFFEADGAFWCLQFSRFLGLGWKTVKGYSRYENPGDSDQPPSGQTYGVLKFDSYEAVESYVKDRGIDRAYSRMPESYLTAIMDGGVPTQDPAREAENEYLRKIISRVITEDRAQAATRVERAEA